MENKQNENRVELLIPAGSLETLKVALRYGADAVYCGGEYFSLRAKATNFSKDDLIEGIKLVHEQNKKIYITANILAHNEDIDKANDYLKELNELKPDGIIIADLGIFNIAKEICKGIPLHISTQANTVNYQAANMWYELGAKRIVPGRELSLFEIKTIREKTPKELEIECFIHGAMCISYSGRCLLSAFMTGRESNLGECTHPCRWKYAVVEEERPGEYMPIEENERGTYIFNSKDLCMIEHIPDLIEAKIDSFKIEGRMKTALYIATVARTYRKAIDDYYNGCYKENLDWYKNEITKCTYREYTTAFYYGKPNEEAQVYANNTYKSGALYLGTICDVDEKYAYLEQKNKFALGDIVEIMKPNGEDIKSKIISMYDMDKKQEILNCPHSKQKLKIEFSVMPEVGDIIRV